MSTFIHISSFPLITKSIKDHDYITRLNNINSINHFALCKVGIFDVLSLALEVVSIRMKIRILKNM